MVSRKNDAYLVFSKKELLSIFAVDLEKRFRSCFFMSENVKKKTPFYVKCKTVLSNKMMKIDYFVFLVAAARVRAFTREM